jgi:inorganic pyrophosphatase
MLKEDIIEVYIEMPKGDDRRRHLSYDKTELLDLGPTKKVIPVNEGKMPIAYGFAIGTLQKDESAKNPDEIPDEVDVLLYSYVEFKVGQKTKAVPIAFITREDDDHKVVAVDSTTKGKIKKWDDIPSKERDLILKYFGYKSPIKLIENAKVAVEYIKKNRVSKKHKKD